MDETKSELLELAEARERIHRLAMIAVYLLDDPNYTKNDAVSDIAGVIAMLQESMG